MAQSAGQVGRQHGSQALPDGRVLRRRLSSAGLVLRAPGPAVPRQPPEGHHAQLGQAVAHLLLVGVLAGLHAALLQRVVVAEEAGQQVPQNPGLIQVRLQEEVHSEGADALHRQRRQARQTLRHKHTLTGTKLQQ